MAACLEMVVIIPIIYLLNQHKQHICSSSCCVPSSSSGFHILTLILGQDLPLDLSAQVLHIFQIEVFI